MASQDPGSSSHTGKPALRRAGSGRLVSSKADQAESSDQQSSDRIQEIADIANHVVSELQAFHTFYQT